jgi:hypothetical protein
MSEQLYIIPGGIGAASNVKMINQLLAGTHIAAAAEAMGLAAKARLNTRQVYDIIVNAAGNSWMFQNRVPNMLDNDLTPYSALDIFVKDMVYMYPSRFHGIRGFTQFLGHCHIYCKSPWVSPPIGIRSRTIISLCFFTRIWTPRRFRGGESLHPFSTDNSS